MLGNLRPQYAKKFRCIGTECEDTCCHGLDVVIDKDGYHRLQSIPSFQPRMQEHFVILDQASDSRYARIQLTPSYSCPFLSAERLCGIQQEHGEYYLAELCATYPRVSQRIDGLRETALLLSCPEAARLVLLDPHLLPDEEQSSELPRYHRLLKERPARAHPSPHQYLWDLREFTLLLLRDRAYALWQRLFMLGMFCRRLNEVTVAQQLDLIPQLLRTYAEMVSDGRLRPAMDSIPTQTALQLSVVLQIINRQLEDTDISHVRFRECVQDFLDGIRFEQGPALETFVPSYQEAAARYYQPFMQQHPHILENYLVNYVFRTRFPYGVSPEGEANNPLTEYVNMCGLYALIKGLLIGMAGQYREAFSTAHVVKLIQTFAKAVEQCPKFQVANYLNLANADAIAVLLKNDA